MSKHLFIGFAAYKQSGKNTAASLLAKQFPGYEAHTIGFADKLKDEVASIIGISRQKLDENKETFRHNLQDHGQEAKRTRGELVWVTELSKTIQALRDEKKNQLFLITDCRFPFEARWIQELGGYIVKVERYPEPIDTHESETAVDKIRGTDYYLPNKGSLRDLEREVRWLSQIIKLHYRLI